MCSTGYRLIAMILLFASCTAKSDTVIEEMISWVHSKGGSFSDKLEIRRMDPSDDASPFGVFARENIETKETLMHVPRECYLDIMDDAEEMDLLEGDEAAAVNRNNLCKLSHKLMSEMELGHDSKYAPYISYLKTQEPGQLPVHWSKPGRDLLRALSRPGSEVVDWIDLHFKKTGCIRDDPHQEHMVEMTIQRSFDVAFIPLWDMVNHHNGLINTENDSMYSEEGLVSKASTHIAKGEQIFASYDLCVDCYDVEDYWGTPEILKDFGFVEDYPHRWTFPDEGVWFEIVRDDINSTLDVEFDTEEEDSFGVPNATGVVFMKKELRRLKMVGAKLLLENPTPKKNVPEHELDMIMKYYDSVTSGLSLAIKQTQ